MRRLRRSGGANKFRKLFQTQTPVKVERVCVLVPSNQATSVSSVDFEQPAKPRSLFWATGGVVFVSFHDWGGVQMHSSVMTENDIKPCCCNTQLRCIQ